MTQPVKPKRRFSASRRQAQASETRQQILKVSNTLLLSFGYSNATIDLIAQEAGVSPETIYAVVGNKERFWQTWSIF